LKLKSIDYLKSLSKMCFVDVDALEQK